MFLPGDRRRDTHFTARPFLGIIGVMSAEQRRHPRFPIALRAHLGTPRGQVTTVTAGVSREGLSATLTTPLLLDEEIPVAVELPDGRSVQGVARCKTVRPDGVCGLQLALADEAMERWNQFLDEEESTGSLWRMIGRYSRNPEDAESPRGLRESVGADELRFHTVGENGEAYRIAFEKHVSDPGDSTDLATLVPGFRERARRLVRRVLREPMTLKLDERAPAVTARVAELVRGGFAYVQVEPGIPVGMVSLGAGELFLVSRNGQGVFPFFSDADLERIACDTFRQDLSRAVFSSPTTPGAVRSGGARPAPVTLPPLPRPQLPERFRRGLDAVRFAQAASDDVQVRRYGAREVYFHPSVWARLKTPAGELMGPTIHDGAHVCVLALIGPGAPRVARLDESSDVSLLKPLR